MDQCGLREASFTAGTERALTILCRCKKYGPVPENDFMSFVRRTRGSPRERTKPALGAVALFAVEALVVGSSLCRSFDSLQQGLLACPVVLGERGQRAGRERNVFLPCTNDLAQ